MWREKFNDVTYQSVGRPTAKPENALVRLRKALSTPEEEMTRKAFSRKTGIPVPSLRDLESGRYRLTVGTAMRITFVTGVHWESLLRGDDPLQDLTGAPFTFDSQQHLPKFTDHDRLQDEIIASCVLKAAQNKGCGQQFSLWLRQWLEDVSKELDLDEAISEQLMETALINERFDLSQVPDRFLAEELGGELKPSFGRKLRSLVEKAAGFPKTE